MSFPYGHFWVRAIAEVPNGGVVNIKGDTGGTVILPGAVTLNKAMTISCGWGGRWTIGGFVLGFLFLTG